jgi:hypothetical protein
MSENKPTRAEAWAMAYAEGRAQGRVEGRAEERQWLRDVVRDVLNAAARDIGEWVQLAERNRKESLDYKHDPLCATDAGIYKSRIIVGRIARAVAEIDQEITERKE